MCNYDKLKEAIRKGKKATFTDTKTNETHGPLTPILDEDVITFEENDIFIRPGSDSFIYYCYRMDNLIVNIVP